MSKFKIVGNYMSFSRNIQIIVISEIILAAAFGIYGFLQILYLNSIGIEANKIGLIFSIGSLFSMIGFFLGPFIHMFGRKTILLLGCLLSALGIMFYISVTSYTFLLLSQILTNVGLCFIQVTELQLLYSYTTPDKECCAYSYKSSINFIASMIGGLVAGNINKIYLFRNIGYKQLFILSTIMILVAFSVRLFLLPREKRVKINFDDAKKSVKETVNLLKTHKSIRVFAMLLFIITIGGSAVWPFNNLILKDKYNISNTGISIISSLITSLNMLSVIVMPSIIKKIGIKKFEMSVLISLTIFTLMLSFGFNSIFFSVILILRCASACLVGSSLDTSMMSHIELENRDIFAGVKLLVVGVASSIGQLIGGFMIERLNFKINYIYSLFVLVFVVIFFYKEVNCYLKNRDVVFIKKAKEQCICHLRHIYVRRN